MNILAALLAYQTSHIVNMAALWSIWTFFCGMSDICTSVSRNPKATQLLHYVLL